MLILVYESMPLQWDRNMVLSPRAGYRTMKMAGSIINRTMKQTKAAISIWRAPRDPWLLGR